MSASGAAAATIREATRELMASWHRVRETWRDAKAEEFAAAHLKDLGDEAGRAVKVIADIERLISKIHADCE
ncbi:hypothetical protein [Haloferula sargassicola]|uniref:Uncharacterized protein n=1 Tax=Haloferula sargassicola TaxID=490096 RepID=A0ABP9UT57_9BACT